MTAQSTRSGRSSILFNLVVISLLGAFVSVWLLRFTELFASIGGLLGTGGALAWLTVVWKLLPTRRAKRLQASVGYCLFERPFMGILFLALLIGAILAACCIASLQVEVAPDSPPTEVWIHAEGQSKDSVEPDYVKAGETLRSWYWVGFRGTTSLVVESRKYPALTVPIRAFHRSDRTVPDSLVRPVVLVRGPAYLIAGEKGKVHLLKVRIDNGQPVEIPFDGYPVWVGCEAIDIPYYVLDQWKDDFKDIDRLTKLREPRSHGGLLRPLQSSTVVEAWLVNIADGKNYSAGVSLSVRPASRYENMVQVLWIQ